MLFQRPDEKTDSSLKPSSFLSLRSPPSPYSDHDWLIGLRGLLAIETFVWVFLITFVPATVKDAETQDGPLYQVVLRKTLSVLFWNQSLIYSWIILLSARTICLPFLRNPSRTVVASSAFRRGIRLWIPTAVGFALPVIILGQIGHGYLDEFKSRTGNDSIATPDRIPNFLVWFNSQFELFWATRDYAKQMGSTAFPTQTLWSVNLIFQQSYTVYMTMVCIPYTRNSWRVKAFIAMILTAWWVQSWAWYSVTGLLLADVVDNMDFRTKAKQGVFVPLPGRRQLRIPSWLFYAAILLAGLIMEYIWVAWRPQFAGAELKAHTGLYNAGSLNAELDLTQPQARDDNYLLILGFMLVIETSEMLQWVFSNRFLMYLGRRSFSYYLVTPTIVYTAGIKVFMHLRFAQNWPFPASTILTLFVCLVTTVPSAEVLYRLVDRPSQALAYAAWDFIIA
ncbi:uncharacterized protein K452DRAFT_287665 [Aplosporella prunicola CBS 121167]|uniref:Acyltransferase 3 domain-containing protein n=1 Tax=Aplosporella prunicola CBS 121167 TaxID=1176127 RepID=A0A6A6BC56_9PEZI|nr:uncharacterized protein K452DRAFT_287665 [Aplosporella prunicola CBS 121167]KAF2141710.1 hypothetical protein K452DRAFT_287665 [Aplosporella prunicola CBS 121167]